MELRCAIVLTLVNLVIATPHEYGVKGGAAARAQAGAVAGAFSGVGGLPLNIQDGSGGVSGSFSKSSSFAASSASSSAGSFSFSGSGASGFPGYFGFPGNTGCKSGGCPDSGGTYGSQGPVGNGQSSFNGAFAGAAAGAFSGVQGYNGANGCNGNDCSVKQPCHGKDCKDVTNNPSSATTTITSPNDTPKCTSGQCSTNSEPNSSGGSTDISCAKGQCGANLSSASTPTGGNIVIGCSSGACSTSTEIKTPDHDGLNDISVGIGGSLSTSDNLNNKDDKIVSSTGSNTYCSSGNCEKPSHNENPSTNNPHSAAPNSATGMAYVPVPNSSAPQPDSYKQPNLPKENIPACVGSHCGNKPGSPSPTHLNVPNQPHKCTTDTCEPTTNTAGNAFDSKPPTHSEGGFNPQNQPSGQPSHSSSSNAPNIFQTPSSSVTNCASGNCGSYPTGHNPDSKPLVPNPPTNCASGICEIYPSSKPTYNENTRPEKNPTQQGVSPSGLPNCVAGNCGSQLPNQPESTYFYETPGSLGTTSAPKPPNYHHEATSNKSPNCVSGNCSPYSSNQYPNTQISGPNTPYPGTNVGPTACISGDCLNSPSEPSRHDTPGMKYPTHPVDNLNSPHNPVPTCAFGNCAIGPKPPGGLPNCASGNCANIPRPELGSTNCASGVCSSYQPGKYPSFQTSQFNTPSNPSSASVTKLPAPSQGSSFTAPTNCASGNCGSSPPPPTSQAGSKLPGQATEPYPDFVPLGPTSPKPGLASSHPSAYPSESTNSAVKPTSNTGVVGGVYPSSSTFGTLKPNADKDQIYTGGFGGPPGILNPFEYKAPPPEGYQSTSNNKPSVSPPCTSGSCAPQPGHLGSNASPPCTSGSCSPQPGNLGSNASPPCTSGSCAPQPGHLGSNASPPCTSGSCAPQPGHLGSNAPPPCTSGSCATQPGHLGSNAPPPCTSGSCAPQPGHLGSNAPPPCTSGSCATQPGHLGSNASPPCTSGSCASKPNNLGSNVNPISKPTTTGNHNTESCATGKCDSPTHSPTPVSSGSYNVGFSAAAVSSDGNTAIYTGGFGGPPGVLKPYDDGKIPSAAPQPHGQNAQNSNSSQGSTHDNVQGSQNNSPYPHGQNLFNSPNGNSDQGSPHNNVHGTQNSSPYSHGYLQFESPNGNSDQGSTPHNNVHGSQNSSPYAHGHHLFDYQNVNSGQGNIPYNNVHGSQNNLHGGHGYGPHFGTAGFGGAFAGASAGSYSGGNYAGDHKAAGGCGGGCGHSGGGSLGGNYGLSTELELPKIDFLNGLHKGLHAAGAAAKSLTGVLSGAGANSFAIGGSFAGSSAHAASGSAVKGGYGR